MYMYIFVCSFVLFVLYVVILITVDPYVYHTHRKANNRNYR